jgi:hypothetical protein
MGASLHPSLLAALEQPENDTSFEVILELVPVQMESVGSRTEKIDRLRAAFQARAEPVERAVRAAGGEVLGEAWINSTLKCRIPARALSELKDHPDIMKIDLPRPLSRSG